MSVRRSSEYRREATKNEPFELELESGEIITFDDPNTLDTETAFDLASTSDPREVCELLLGDDAFNKFWTEWRYHPVSETNELIKDAMNHYGVSMGKRGSLPR